MLVDIHKPSDSEITEVRFKAIDLKTQKDRDDLTHVASAIASSYCFEAMELASNNFELFLDTLKPRVTYIILIGLQNNRPILSYGTVRASK